MFKSLKINTSLFTLESVFASFLDSLQDIKTRTNELNARKRFNYLIARLEKERIPKDPRFQEHHPSSQCAATADKNEAYIRIVQNSPENPEHYIGYEFHITAEPQKIEEKRTIFPKYNLAFEWLEHCPNYKGELIKLNELTNSTSKLVNNTSDEGV